jgi:predicted restriction endonuclease
LIEGIYKPKWSDHALSIASMKENPYRDRLTYLPDGRWRITYSAKVGGPRIATNQGLFNCLNNKEPIIVLEQLSDKTHRKGTWYRLMGLGLIESYNAAADTFSIHHVDYATIEMVSGADDSEQAIASVMRSFTLEEFKPFVQENKAVYQISPQKRDPAFKNVVLEQYDYSCAVTGVKYHSDHLVEAQAAHIISKEHFGSDDPRNGLSLSRTAHWAFDIGIFTITDQYEILVHPKAKTADFSNFKILEMDRKQISLPEDENYFPHPDALKWHKNHVFNCFR